MPAFLYIMSCNGCMKIGIAQDPEKRIKGLQTGNPHKVKLVDQYKIGAKGFLKYLERRVHKYLDDIRLEGEWFTEDIPRAQETIKKIIQHNGKKKCR